MITHRPAPSESWSFIVAALAELGRVEIERRQRAVEMCTQVPTVGDQTDDRRNSASTTIETTEATEDGPQRFCRMRRAPNDRES
jgi:hypothetical protein